MKIAATTALFPIDGRRRSIGRLMAGLFLMLGLAACGPDDAGSESLGSDSESEATEAAADDSDGADDASGETDSADEDADGTDDSDDGAGSDETGDDADSDDGETESSNDDAADGAGDPSTEATVTVIDPGAEPRTELRIDVPDGLTAVMVTSQQQTLDQVVDGEAVPSAGSITTEITSQLTATALGDGRLEVLTSVTDAAVTDAPSEGVAAQIEASLDPVLGLETTVTIDDRGRPLGTEIAGLEGFEPAVAAQLQEIGSSDQIAVPLPDEAVGVGATWEVVQLIPVSGLELEQVLRYELVSIDGSTIELAVVGTQSVPAGAVMNALGQDAEVVRWEIDVSGTVTQDLAALVPVSTVTVEGVQEFEFQGTTLEQSLSTVTSVAPG